MFAKNRNPRPQNKIYEKQAKNITLVGTCPHSNKSKIRCKHGKIDTPNAYTLRSHITCVGSVVIKKAIILNIKHNTNSIIV